jgi:hypothetical protein
LKLADDQAVRLNADGSRALVTEGGKRLALREPAKPKPIAAFDVPGGVYEVDFTLDGQAFLVRTEGGGLSVYDANKGGRIADLAGVGGDYHAVYCETDKKHINVWTSEGRVLRYRWTWNTWAFHWPATSAQGRPHDEPCDDQQPEPWEYQAPSASQVEAPFRYGMFPAAP